MPIITDIPYNKTLNEKQIAFSKKLESCGFVMNSIASRMCKNIENEEIKNVEMFGFKIEKASIDDLDAICEIWNENFEPIKNLMYSKNEIQQHLNDIYVCKSNNNEVIGAMGLVEINGYGWVEHISIKNSLQGKGIGSLMERYYINHFKMLGIKNLLLYTINDNITAQVFHKSFGFTYDGRCNCQYLFKG